MNWLVIKQKDLLKNLLQSILIHLNKTPKIFTQVFNIYTIILLVQLDVNDNYFLM